MATAVVTKPKTLKRVRLIAPRKNNELAMIAEKASTLLGYSGALTAHHVAGALGRVLVKLDIRPFEVAAVKEYKDERKKTAVANARRRLSMYDTVSARWQEIPMDEYTRTTIPMFVLSKAVQIKEACPDAEFFVDTLKVSKRIDPDPFLIVKMGREKYWIEVWDERKFERKVVDARK